MCADACFIWTVQPWFYLWWHLTFSDQISSLSKSCYSHIRELCCIRLCLDYKTAGTIAASIVHSKLDYCNSLYYNLPKSQINRLQQIQNCLARTVVKAPKSSHITPILKSLHWLKINEHIEYKLLSLTYEVLTANQCDYLESLISESVALLVARQTNNWKFVGSRRSKVVCISITVLTGNRLGWTVRCGRPPLLLPSCRKLGVYRLSALKDSDLAWVNGKSGRQSWCYADAFQRSIISGAIYHFTIYIRLLHSWQNTTMDNWTHIIMNE